MRPDGLYLAGIVGAADEIGSFLLGWTKDRFTADHVMRSAVLYQVTIIGEAASRVSPSLRAHYPEVPWPDVIAFRNIVVHAYFSLHWHTVWVAATANVPRLRQQIAAILRAEFPEDSAPTSGATR